MINYARLTPVYIAKMLSLKDEDPETWNMFNSGNFSVNKTLIPFSAIGVDHAIEQENRAVKVLGGIKGIAYNQKALDEYFLTVSEMRNIIEDFCEVFNIHSEAPKRTQHYQLTGSKNQRINDNVTKLSEVFASHEVDFENSDVLNNVLTKKVPPDNLAKEFLEIEKEGQCLYEQFIEEQIVGSKCIWDSITKRKLPTFVNNKKIVTVKIRNQLINIRAERKLMSTFIVAARSRPDIDLPSYLGKHEFSAVPRSLFTEEGDLIRCNDKSKMTAEMLQWLPVENIGDEGDRDLDYKVIVFDGMAVVNKIDIKKLKLRSCKEFASAFVQKVKKESQGFDEVRVIFDRYIEESLKSGTRTIRTGSETICYKISDDTIIQHLTTKQFLSDIKTKQELTKYLSKKLFDVYHDVAFVVSYEFIGMSNISDLDVNLKDHCHEEADTCIVLHSLDVAKRNPFSDLVV